MTFNATNQKKVAVAHIPPMPAGNREGVKVCEYIVQDGETHVLTCPVACGGVLHLVIAVYHWCCVGCMEGGFPK